MMILCQTMMIVTMENLIERVKKLEKKEGGILNVNFKTIKRNTSHEGAIEIKIIIDNETIT